MLNLNRAELGTVLAALRFYQQSGMGDADLRSDAIHDIATEGNRITGLDAEDIDGLCQRLNTDAV